MNELLLIWQWIHYWVYQFHLFISDTIIGWPFKKIFDNKWVLKQYKKRGVNNPYKLIRWATTRPNFGVLNWKIDGTMILLMGLLFYSFLNFLSALCGKIIGIGGGKYFFILFIGLPSVLINYFLLWKDDKYLVYFKEFEKEPKAVKRKWAWISFGMVLGIIGLLILSFWVLTKSIHR